MKHFGDITKISGYELPVVDIITGGSPCQDLSVAGKRAGLAGERSGLFMEQIRIVKEMRERDRESGRTAWAVRPRYMVWENVPGAFSSNGGKDFQAVLEEIVGIIEDDVPDLSDAVQGKWTKAGCLYDEMGAWSIAWRVHDAQFWGVPQRRKRIALVADFGGLSAPEILFERKGLSGDSEPCRAEGQGTAAGAESGTGSTSYGIDHVITTGGNCTAEGPCIYEEKEATLKAAGPHAVFSFQERAGKPGGGKGILIQNEHVVALSTLNNQAVLDNRCWSIDEKMGQTYVHDDMGNTISARDYKQPQAVVVEPILLESNQNHATIQTDGISTALPAAMGEGGGYVPMVAHALSARFDGSPQPDKGNGSNIVAYAMQAFGEYKASDTASSCKMRDFKDATDLVAAVYCTVRRLTPLECERLQGFPDGWTDIGEWMDGKGKKHKDADSPRYKALGNSIALPFWAWLARRICAQYERPMTMASLFDGIGGFPLVFSRAGAIPVWASEIEEFPIAVTKLRFPEAEDGD